MVERLESTCTVLLGLFDQCECSVAEVQVMPNDILVLYTDGVTEAANTQGEEFSECHFIEASRAGVHVPVQSLLEGVVAAAHQFSGDERADDITLVIARCTS